jgi:acyl-CoA reductase-like NAD-dependent aldehyde dehydrogenase
MQVREQLFIDGAWVDPSGTGTIDVINAATEQVMGRIPAGDATDIDSAVAAAKAAFPSWSKTPVEERGKYLTRLADALGARTEEIALSITGEVGTPIAVSRMAQAMFPAMAPNNYAQVLAEFPFEERLGTSLIVREPIGVVGCITPWNYPLNQVMAKISPAIGAGCTVVLKPSEVAPLTAFILAEVMEEIGLPAGVFNLVTGTGPVVGEALASHPDVAMISFTGSTRAGKRVAELASGTVKKVALELGGKSPFIILDDAPIEDAVKAGLNSAYFNGGQTCVALTRMLAPRSKYEEVVAAAKTAAEGFNPGDPMDETTRLGPMISETQRDRVRGFINKGIEEGARLVTGGPDAPDGLETGYFIRPTVFADVSNDMTIAQQEIFGPVLSIIPYDDDDDAVKIANDTIYGLAAGVYGGDKERAIGVARRIEAGQVDVNGPGWNPLAPFGGYKQSGLGREYGKFGLEEFLEVKSLQNFGPA